MLLLAVTPRRCITCSVYGLRSDLAGDDVLLPVAQCRPRAASSASLAPVRVMQAWHRKADFWPDAVPALQRETSVLSAAGRSDNVSASGTSAYVAVSMITCDASSQ